MASSDGNRRFVLACQAGLVVGLLLVLAGALWQMLAKPQHVWSDAKAGELQEARTTWHDLTYNMPAADSAPRDAKRAAARRRYERLQAELDEAIAIHRQRGPRLMYAGLAMVVVFGVGHLSAQRR